MKKAIVTTLVLAMTVSMAGCGAGKKAPEKAASSAAAAVSSTAAAVTSEAEATASEATAAVSEAAAAAADAVSTAAEAVTDTAADAASTTVEMVLDTESAAEEAVAGVVAQAESALAAAGESVSESAIEEAAGAAVATALTAAESAAENVAEGAADVLADAASTALEVPDTAISAVEQVVEETAASVAEDVTAAVDSAATVIEDVESASIAEEAESAAEDVLSVMSYEEYAAAPVDTKVMVETYVQAKQSWWEDKATLYTADEDGAYFIYNAACTQEDYDKLVEGQKIIVTGYKAEWSGEVEIADATFEIADGNYVSEVKDVTELLGKDELADSQNQKVAFKGLTVEATKDADGNDAAYIYNWDGSGQEGDDLYFNASLDGNTYTFVVESYLCDKDSDVYKAVKELKVGDKIDMEGFLYWYEGAQPHITSVTAAA